MSLLEDLHAAHKARQRRFSAAAIAPVALPLAVEVTPAPTPRPAREWHPPPFSSQPIAHIQSLCCMYFRIPRFELLSPRRTKEIVYQRQVAMYLCKTVALGSLPDIGRRFGGRDHTTVLHGIRKIAQLIRADWMVAYDVAHIEAAL